MTALPDWDVASDAELVRAASAGDRQAFAEIYDRYGNRLHDFCIGLVRNRDVAADCVQDVFCIAATKLSQLKNPDSLRPWLYSIAHHEALRSIHRSGRERAVEELPDEPSADAGPETLAARHELAELIAEAAGGLSDRDRAVLDLTYRHGLDGSELAEALGVSLESAKKLTQRLRETIERSLGALLVSRSVLAKSEGCAELRMILDGWDGRLTVLLRKRIARHVESCPVCDEERRRLVNPVALLGATPALVPAPGWLRSRTLDRVQLPGADKRQPDAPGRHGRVSSRRVLVRAGVVIAVLVAVLGVFAALRVERHATVDPANLTRTVPESSSAPLTSAARQQHVAPTSTQETSPPALPATTAVTSSPEPVAPPPLTSPVVASPPSTTSTRTRPPAPVPPAAPPSPPIITEEPAPPPVMLPPVSATPIKPPTPVKVRPGIPTKPVIVTTQPPFIQ
jgi:RNA polymerase sigma factor (sigma-70 family)